MNAISVSSAFATRPSPVPARELGLERPREGVKGRKPRSPRRQREHDRHRREILDSALKLFGQRGCEQTSMTDVAHDAEFAVGSLYNFFKNKQVLYEALVLDVVRTCSARVVEALDAPGNEAERIERYIDVTTRLFFEQHDAARLYFAETSGRYFERSAALRGEALDIHERTRERLISVFRSGAANGLFVDAPAESLALAIEGVSTAIWTDLIRRPGTFTEAEVSRLRKRLFFDAVRVKPRLRLATGTG